MFGSGFASDVLEERAALEDIKDQGRSQDVLAEGEPALGQSQEDCKRGWRM